MGKRELISSMIEAVFPSNIYCIVCGSLIDRSRPYSLCDKCIRKIRWINGRTCTCCGKALPDTYSGRGADRRRICYDCMQRKHEFTRGWSCMTYGLHEREIMMDIKYNNRGYIARKMGDVLYDRMEPLIEAARSRQLQPFDIVIPVPVSKRRLAKRGYNQSELMARQFLHRWSEADRAGGSLQAGTCPGLETHILVRQKETSMLRSLNPEERRLALRDAFGVTPALRHRIQGRNILLIDDIYTTGATADACSKVLLENGAAAVYLLTLASGGNRRPKDET